MNVLVYTGPEILQVAANHALVTLRSTLVPHYTVQSITRQALSVEPWQKSCALLVLPKSRNRFISSTSKQIKDFVESGGICLLLGTGANAVPRSGGLGTGITSLSFGQEEEFETPLKFYDKLNNCYITFDEGVDEKLKEETICILRTSTSATIDGIYNTNDTKLRGFGDLKGVAVLANWDSELAGLSMAVGRGKIAVWGPSIEYPLTEEPLSSLIEKSSKLSSEKTKEFEKSRRELIRTTLTELGLHIPEEKQKITRPLPQFLTSVPFKPNIVSQILNAIAAPQLGDQLTILKDSNDEFYFHPLQESLETLRGARKKSETASDPATWQPKDIIVCPDGKLPSSDLTPLFDLGLYYETLSALRSGAGLKAFSESWGMGESLLYGEVVTSTQTMLDK